jgi:hypothetical protein
MNDSMHAGSYWVINQMKLGVITLSQLRKQVCGGGSGPCRYRNRLSPAETRLHSGSYLDKLRHLKLNFANLLQQKEQILPNAMMLGVGTLDGVHILFTSICKLNLCGFILLQDLEGKLEEGIRKA